MINKLQVNRMNKTAGEIAKEYNMPYRRLSNIINANHIKPNGSIQSKGHTVWLYDCLAQEKINGIIKNKGIEKC